MCVGEGLAAENFASNKAEAALNLSDELFYWVCDKAKSLSDIVFHAIKKACWKRRDESFCVAMPCIGGRMGLGDARDCSASSCPDGVVYFYSKYYYGAAGRNDQPDGCIFYDAPKEGEGFVDCIKTELKNSRDGKQPKVGKINKFFEWIECDHEDEGEHQGDPTLDVL